MRSPGAVSIGLLADFPELVEEVGRMRWIEWGAGPPRMELARSVEITRAEAGRDELPVTFVAVDESGEAAGAVGLGPFDLAERRELSPWVWGMVVRRDCRGRGVGRLLLSRLEQFASDQGYPRIWVATGGPAVPFYQRCGWQISERLRVAESGEMATVLAKGPALGRAS